jgi:hypothetical protein
VYFDTNVYDHIDKGFIPADEVSALRAAVTGGALTAYVSSADIEEILGQWCTDRVAAVRKLQVVRDLAGFDRLLKEPPDLLTEAIAAYAGGESPPSPFLGEASRQYLAEHLHAVAAGNWSALDDEIAATIAGVRRRKATYLRGMPEVRARTTVAVQGPETMDWQTFAACWAEAAPHGPRPWCSGGSPP